MLELLDAPLMHMARNAADHGIEAPAVRTMAGKSESGTVIITCEEYEKEITLSVKDDGGGLNYEALRSKAVSLDIIPEDATLTEAQVVNLLFMSGVSTATEVSDISGRGVGMDVVKKNIESAGGKITIKSEAGEGSSFTIRLPKSVTTQIMQGFLFEVGSVQYVIPLSSVHECWVLDPQQITEVIGRGECAARHGEMIKIIDLATVFESEPEPTGVNQLVITVEVEQRLVGFRVSKIFGTRQLVIKPLGQLVTDSQMFLGGAILGNGEVALLCDITKLVEDRFEQGASQSLTSM